MRLARCTGARIMSPRVQMWHSHSNRQYNLVTRCLCSMLHAGLWACQQVAKLAREHCMQWVCCLQDQATLRCPVYKWHLLNCRCTLCPLPVFVCPAGRVVM